MSSEKAIYGEETILSDWVESDVLPTKVYSLTDGKVKSKPLHIKASIYAAIETAAKKTENEESR